MVGSGGKKKKTAGNTAAPAAAKRAKATAGGGARHPLVRFSVTRAVQVVVKRVPLALRPEQAAAGRGGGAAGGALTVLVVPGAPEPPMAVLRPAAHIGVVSEALQVRGGGRGG